MDPILALALIVAAGVAATRLSPIATRGLYLEHATLLALLGVVLGPLAGVLDADTRRALSPVAALAAGWVGFALGGRCERRAFERLAPRLALLALAQAVVVTVGVAALVMALGRLVPALKDAWQPTIPAALALGAIAAVSGPTSVELVADRLGLSPGRRGVLGRLAVLDSLFGFLIFTLAMALAPPGGSAGNLGAALGVLLAVGGGVLVAMLFLALTRREQDLDRLGVILAATVLLAAGLGHAARLSPLLVCAVAGALVIHRTTHRQEILQVIENWEGPLAAVLLILAGAHLWLPTAWLLPAAAVLVAARLALKWGAVRFVPLRGDLPADAGLATAPQGTLAVALGLGYAVALAERNAAAAGGFLATVLFAVALAQLAAPALVRRALGGIQGVNGAAGG